MAIDRTGQVTTTGLMGGGPKLPKAPDMSGLSKGVPQGGGKPTVAPDKTAQTAESPDQNVEKRLQNLSEEQIALLDGMIGQNTAEIFKQIAPEASNLIDQFKGNEDVISLPVSTIVNYAVKMYGGDQQIAVQKFITELSGETSDNNNVPLDTAQASTEGGMMAQEPDTSETDAIDQGLV